MQEIYIQGKTVDRNNFKQKPFEQYDIDIENKIEDDSRNWEFKRKEVSRQTTDNEFGWQQDRCALEKFYAPAQRNNQQSDKRFDFNAGL